MKALSKAASGKRTGCSCSPPLKSSTVTATETEFGVKQGRDLSKDAMQNFIFPYWLHMNTRAMHISGHSAKSYK